VKTAAAALFIAFAFAAAVAGSYALGLHALDQSQRQLCPALALLTRSPVPRPAHPAANPSRVSYRRLYLTFLTIEREYHC
jgi:hypothetical protein